MKYSSLILVILILGCVRNPALNNAKHSLEDSLTAAGYTNKQVLTESPLFYDKENTMLKGYTPFRKGYYYDTTLIAPSLNIHGLRFTKEHYTRSFYIFDFADSADYRSFQTFQPYIDNYCSKHQLPPYFFKHKNFTVLKLIDTP